MYSCRSLLVLGAVWLIYDFLVNIGRGFSLQVFYNNAPIGFLKGYNTHMYLYMHITVGMRMINAISVVSRINVISVICVITWRRFSIKILMFERLSNQDTACCPSYMYIEKCVNL